MREADEVNQHRSESLTATYDMVVDNFICFLSMFTIQLFNFHLFGVNYQIVFNCISLIIILNLVSHLVVPIIKVVH